MEWLKTPPDVPIESKTVSRSIRSAQTQVEQQNFEIRKDLLKYDDVMNRQRHVIYDERRQVLEGADMHEQIRGMIDDVVADYVAGATSDGFPEEWDLDQLWRAFKQLYPVGLSLEAITEEAGGERSGLSAEFITQTMQQDAQAAYDGREAELTPEVMRDLERRVVLSVLDRKWREHLYEMDYLREGIGLRAWAQRDPLVEYQNEGYTMFDSMKEGIKEESVGSLFNLQVQVQESPILEEAPPGADGVLAGAGPAPLGGAGSSAPAAGGTGSRSGAAGGTGSRSAAAGGRRARGRAGQGAAAAPGGQPAPGAPAVPAGLAPRGLDAPQRPGRLQYSAPSADAPGQTEQRTESANGADFSRVGRNAPCPCGSGKKFKQCHGDPRNR
jgi:preprotein translocase subunit SecA